VVLSTSNLVGIFFVVNLVRTYYTGNRDVAKMLSMAKNWLLAVQYNFIVDYIIDLSILDKWNQGAVCIV